ncbi:MAG: hypothetical protein R2711_05920 [Acidimicrobiales bacterium]
MRGDVDGDRDTLRVLNEIWFTLSNLLLPQEVHRDLVSVTKAAVVFGLAAVAVVAVALWVARIGRNLPMSGATFGGGLAVAGLPAWWTLSLTLGSYDGLETERIDLLTRTSLGLLILTGQFLLVRWALLNRTWRAGKLPGDLASVVLWIPEFVPWAMFFASSVLTLAVTSDGAPRLVLDAHRGDDRLGLRPLQGLPRRHRDPALRRQRAPAPRHGPGAGGRGGAARGGAPGARARGRAGVCRGPAPARRA